MARRPVKLYPPSYPLTLFFLAMLVPACCWGLVLLGVSLLSLLSGGLGLGQAVPLVCALALLLPVPFVVRGRRAAMLPVVFSLLGSLLSGLSMGAFNQTHPVLVLGLFALGGMYCVALTHLFRRARPLLESLEKRRVLPLCALGLAAVTELYLAFVMSAAAPPRVVLLGELAFILSFVVLAGALPGLLRPGLSLVTACLGLAQALSSFGVAAWDVYSYHRDPELYARAGRFAASFAPQRGVEALVTALALAALFCLALWLLRRADASPAAHG